ncbi:phytase [Roseivirga misakiensis]|uniref:3-phytase n=1 Tax=Roseivirga misakiensis TaxID=1563681 RepID=A0A1E5T0W1_9BACT|nr:phytase [Roseivirga misakiensis]OEK05022.1 3-phytase [Roseivirga misakiensis]
MKNITYIFSLLAVVLLAACGNSQIDVDRVKPVVVTEPVNYDTDDPAIWVNKEDPSKSLIIGTDKNEDGALFVFDLDGKIIKNKTVSGLKRPNNVDLVQGAVFANDTLDFAVTGERLTHKLRVFSLPDMKPIDGGGIPVYVGETALEHRDLMGIALYKRPSDNAVFVIMGRKTGPTDGTYLWQYKLGLNDMGDVTATLVRKFGKYSGIKEIEAIAVDHELGYIYYSDEGVGVRKYYADPEKGNEELALFATTGFRDDHEGISIYDTGNGSGFILVSDQQANAFHVFKREGSVGDKHQHELVKVVKVSTRESDGSEISNVAFNDTFKKGIFVAMSDNKTFQYYRVEDILDIRDQ